VRQRADVEQLGERLTDVSKGVPRTQLDAGATDAPATITGTYSREWSVLGVAGSLP